MRALVTGGTGFIGANVVAALLDAGYTVRAFHRPTSNLAALAGMAVEHAVGDLLDPATLSQAAQGCDLVFHVAAVSSYWRSSREDVYRINVQGTRAVMEACRQAGVRRVVYTSSVAAIGIPPRGTIATEEQPYTPGSEKFVYSHSKYLAEKEVLEAVARGLPAVIVNPAVVIGPRDLNFISGSIIREVYRRRVPCALHGGMAVIAADDVARGHLAAAQKGRIGERYILVGENLTHRQILQIVAEVVGVPAPRLTLPRALLGPLARLMDCFNRISPWPPVVSGEQIRLSSEEFYFDGSKARCELGFQPRTTFREAVRQAFEWYKEQGYLN
jgi:dihydroflavonol-4-reductase